MGVDVQVESLDSISEVDMVKIKIIIIIIQMNHVPYLMLKAKDFIGLVELNK